jgi:DNA-binding NtrC family response regulator
VLPASARAVEESTRIVQEPPHLLLSEGDDVLRDALTEVLVREGYRVAVARSLNAAFRAWAGQPFDAVVGDLDDGNPVEFEVLRSLVRLHPGARIVLMAAERDPWRWIQSELRGLQLLEKPFSSEDLRSALGGLGRPGS